MRLRLDLAYDGSDFAGWARQPALRTVQGTLEDGLATILRTGPRGVPAPRLVVAGRTDAGVHARGQVAHVEVDNHALAAAQGRSERDPLDAVLTRLAGVLPPDLVVRRVTLAPPGFDARFSALRHAEGPARPGIASLDRRATRRPFGNPLSGVHQSAVPAISRPDSTRFQRAAAWRTTSFKSRNLTPSPSNWPTSRSAPANLGSACLRSADNPASRRSTVIQSSTLSSGSSARTHSPGRSARSASLRSIASQILAIQSEGGGFHPFLRADYKRLAQRIR